MSGLGWTVVLIVAIGLVAGCGAMVQGQPLMISISVVPAVIVIGLPFLVLRFLAGILLDERDPVYYDPERPLPPLPAPPRLTRPAARASLPQPQAQKKLEEMEIVDGEVIDVHLLDVQHPLLPRPNKRRR